MVRGRFLSSSEQAALDRFPIDIDPDDLVACFTLTDENQADIIARRYGPGGRLAGGLQIGALRLLGFVPAEVTTAPEVAVRFVAGQVDATVDDLTSYTTRQHTISDHITEIERHLGFSRLEPGGLKALGDWIVERALEHDQPILLFRLACDHLKSERQVRPGVSVLERLVATSRQTATEETWRILATGIDASTRERFDHLLGVDDDVKMTRFTWFSQQATEPVGKVIGIQIDKLLELRAIGLDPAVVSELNPNRVRHLAGLGRRMSPQALRRSDPARRYQIVAATLAENLFSLTDEILELFDTALGDADRRARFQLDEARRQAAAAANSTVRLFTRVGRLVLDDTVPDDELRARILASAGGSFAGAVEQAERIARPDGDNHIEYLTSRYATIRQYGPAVIDAFAFHGNRSADELLDAIEILRTLNGTGARLVPPEAPTSFATQAWRRAMTAPPDGKIDRHVWEIAKLFETRAALRGANLWVDHSHRHQDPVNYLLSDVDWQLQRSTTPGETGISLDGHERLAQLDEHLNDRVTDLDEVLAASDGAGARIDNERLVVPSLDAEETDEDVDAGRERVQGLMPSMEIADLLLDVHSWTGCLDGFTHANHSTSRTSDHDMLLLAVLIANGCNLGLADMARSSRFNENQLAWTQNWYVRDDTVEAANNSIINYQHALPMAQRWGSGTLSSSDGQRFPFTVKNRAARANRKYYTGKGASVYTWTSDQHAQYGTRMIPTSEREATYVLDAIFDNVEGLDITIEEHTTDTAGYTDLVFGLFDLCGLKFSPRIRDIPTNASGDSPPPPSAHLPQGCSATTYDPTGSSTAGTTSSESQPPSATVTTLPPCSSPVSRHQPVRTNSPKPSRNTEGSSRRSRSSATSTTPPTDAGSWCSSTRANRCTHCANGSSSPTSASSCADGPTTKTSKPNASP